MADVRYLTVTEALERCRAAAVPARVVGTVLHLTERGLVTVTGPGRPDQVLYRAENPLSGRPYLVAPEVASRAGQSGPETWEFEVLRKRLYPRLWLEVGSGPQCVRVPLRLLEVMLSAYFGNAEGGGPVEAMICAAEVEAAIAAATRV